MSERYVRICPAHRRVLDELPDGHLACPADGGHPVADGHHATLDRVKGTVTQNETGEETVPRRKTNGQAPEGAGRTSYSKKGGSVLERSKFIDAAGVVLWVQLARERDRFVVRWKRVAGDKTTSGATGIESSETEARRQYVGALEQARERKWAPAVPGRPVSILPIPLAAVRKRD